MVRIIPPCSFFDFSLDLVAGGVYHIEGDDKRPLGEGGAIYYVRVEGCIHDFTDDDCAWFDACDILNEIYHGCSSRYYQQ